MRESREHVHNSCRNIALVTQACATLSQHSVFDDGSSQLPHSAVVVKAVWWLVLGLVSLHSGGWQKWNMSISVDGVQERHCATFWNYTREYLQGHSMLVAFVMVETAFQQDWILFHRVHPCYMFRHRYYFQVFINTKKKNEKRILQYYFNVCVFH